MKNALAITCTAVGGLLLAATAIELCNPAPLRAAPREMTISGFLEDEASGPMTGTFPAEIQFYADKDESVPPVATRQTTVSVEDGVFTMSIPIPDEILILDSAWYSLAVDHDGDGFEPEETFDDLFQISSVPYALASRPATLFTSHGAIPKSNFALTSFHAGSRLFVAPFETPPTGVEFDLMMIYGGNTETVYNVFTETSYNAFNFGVYDRFGEMIYSTMNETYYTIGSSSYGSAPIRMVSVEGRLAPSTWYYTAWGLGQASTSLQMADTISHALPSFGTVPEAVSNGVLPEEFDPLDIEPGNRYPLSITFVDADNEVFFQPFKAEGAAEVRENGF